MTRPPNNPPTLAALLKTAAGLPEYRRQTIEPILEARQAAAEKLTAAAAELMKAWADLYQRSEELCAVLQAEGIEKIPAPRIQPGTLINIVAAELYRLCILAKPGGSAQRLPWVCGAAIVRPDLLVPLPEQIKAANELVRLRLT